jgi:hypothetical protein
LTPAPSLIPCRDSPYRDGEKEDGRDDGAISAPFAVGEILDDGVLLPVSIPIAFTHLGCACR